LRQPRSGLENAPVKLERLSRLGLTLVALLIATASTTGAGNHRHHHHASAYNRHGCNATATWDCRSLTVKHQFWELTGHPHGWKGHIVDHRRALVCGGPDAVSNMQWETIAEARVKDRWEAIGSKDKSTLTVTRNSGAKRRES
jgi:hypothetical protein